MSMTKSDFELIAYTIRLEREPTEPWDRLVDRIVDELGRQYPRFNKDKFINACQLEGKWK